jgi:hypothetical protein
MLHGQRVARARFAVSLRAALADVSRPDNRVELTLLDDAFGDHRQEALFWHDGLVWKNVMLAD